MSKGGPGSEFELRFFQLADDADKAALRNEDDVQVMLSVNLVDCPALPNRERTEMMGFAQCDCACDCACD